MEELKRLIGNIVDKTGIELAIFDASGECVVGRKGSNEIIDNNIDDVFLDKINGRTLFPIEYKNKKYIGRIAKIGQTEENYACLISQICENYFNKSAVLNRAEFNRAVLFGELNKSSMSKYMSDFSIPLTKCFVLLIKCKTEKVDEVISSLEGFYNKSQDFTVRTNQTNFALIKYLDSGAEEYRSTTELAEYLREYIVEETGVKTVIFMGGIVNNLSEINTSYSQALEAERLSKNDFEKSNIHSYRDYVLVKILEDLPKYKLNEYCSALTDDYAREIFNDADMVNTAQAFFDNNLNVSQTANQLFMHRNTLTYRIEKIEKATGLDIGRFTDAVTFRLISLLMKMGK